MTLKDKIELLEVQVGALNASVSGPISMNTQLLLTVAQMSVGKDGALTQGIEALEKTGDKIRDLLDTAFEEISDE